MRPNLNLVFSPSDDRSEYDIVWEPVTSCKSVETQFITLVDTHLSKNIEIGACSLLSEQLAMSCGKFSKDRLTIDHIHTIAWNLLFDRKRERKKYLYELIEKYGLEDVILYLRRIVGPSFPTIRVPIPDNIDTHIQDALALFIRIAEQDCQVEFHFEPMGKKFLDWIKSFPDSHTKATLRSLWQPEASDDSVISIEEKLDDIFDELGIRALEIEEDFLKSSQKSHQRQRELLQNARSFAEMLLYRMLEEHQHTKGLFALNVCMPFKFGLRAAEVDLYSQELKMGLEVDGPHHFWGPDAYRRDRRKDILLQQHGIWVLRFLAEDIHWRKEEVLDAIIAVVKNRKNLI